jgi:hypothetical protein
MVKKQRIEKTGKKSKERVFVKSSFRFSAVLICILMLSTFSADEVGAYFDYQGVSLFYGRGEWTHIGPDASDDYTWSNVSYVLGKNLSSWLSFEVLPGVGYLKSSHYDETGSAELRLLLHLHHGIFFLKAGGGVAHLVDPANIPDLADSDFYTIISGRMGICYCIQKNNHNIFEFSAGYAIEHLSDPFKDGREGDTGWNAGAIFVQIRYNF